MKLVSHHLGLAAALGLSLSTAAAADPIADFYKGKQINWILSAGAGGGYSSYAHVFAPLMPKSGANGTLECTSPSVVPSLGATEAR